MTEPAPPEAGVRRSRGLTAVWLIPIAAFLIVGWLGIKTLVDRGPLVTITFQSAEGLEAGRTKVRYKSLDVGQVESVALSDDLSHVTVTARMTRNVAPAITSGTQFWVVRPRVSPGGITGLTTIVSGPYLAMQPDKHGQPERHFAGLEDPPVLDPDQPGRRFILRAAQLNGLGQNSPVLYRGVVVGEVLGFTFAKNAEGVRLIAFVRAPYDALVHPRSHFWNAGGASISAGPQGVKASIESLQALVAGGVAFDTGEKEPAEAAPNAEFDLFPDETTAHSQPHGPGVAFLVRFPGVVHGLGDNAPVELQGMNVGHVTDVHLEYDSRSGQLSTPATIELYPEVVKRTGGPPPGDLVETAKSELTRLVGEGLRARLATGSLITGQRIVSLELMSDAPPAKLDLNEPVPEIPSVEAGDLDSLTHAATQVMRKISAMPLKEIGQSVRNIADHLDKLTGSPDMKGSIHSLNEALANLSRLTETANTELPALTRSLRQTADAATKTFDALGGNGARGGDLPGLLHELTEAARSMRSLADLLQEHPEALVRGRAGGEL